MNDTNYTKSDSKCQEKSENRKFSVHVTDQLIQMATYMIVNWGSRYPEICIERKGPIAEAINVSGRNAHDAWVSEEGVHYNVHHEEPVFLVPDEEFIAYIETYKSFFVFSPEATLHIDEEAGTITADIHWDQDPLHSTKAWARQNR